MMRDGGSGLFQRPVTLVFLIAVLVAATAFVVAPWFAFRALRDAASVGDTHTLGKIMDYQAVRAGRAPQLVPGGGEPPPPVDLFRDPIGALRQAMQPPPTAPREEVNAWLTPRALDALANGRLPGVAAPEKGAHPWPAVKYWGMNRARIEVADPRTKKRPVSFVFERRGIYTWKLVRISPPDPQVGGSGVRR